MILSTGEWNHGTLYEHVVWEKEEEGSLKVGVRVSCGIAHDRSEPVDYLDCPVASNWTLLRTPAP